MKTDINDKNYKFIFDIPEIENYDKFDLIYKGELVGIAKKNSEELILETFLYETKD